MSKFTVNMFLLVLISNCIVISISSKLNVPRVLLPFFETFSTNFTLEVTEGGCYKWSSSRIAVVQVTPVDVDQSLGCSSRAVVSSASKDKVRNTAIILAEEVHSGQMLRCDVIVDAISSLFITTTTRELYMEEAPEIFEVRAYDGQGNEFSTLDGVEFLWTLSSIGTIEDVKSTKVLKFITFRDSPYETPPSVEQFEQSGRRGNMVLLEGAKTGSAKVTVRLPHPEYSRVPPIEVHLMVVANLIIDPADVYIMPCDTIQFQIQQVQSGRLVGIKLPSPQYYLEVEDPSVAVIDEEGRALGRLEGKSRVLLHDRNVDDKENVKVPSVSLTVVKPYSISLAVLPHRNWVLLVDEPSQIVVELHERDDHKIHIGSKTEAAVEIPAKYFHVERSTNNKTHHAGWPVQVGSAVVKAELLGVEGCPAGTFRSISTQAEMLIFEKIVVKPSHVILPWDPELKPRYEVKLSVTGGDDDFLWSSSNTMVSTVTQSGVINTNSHGMVDIIASMTRNQHNRGVSHVWVVQPTSLRVESYVISAELGTPIYLHVALYVEKPVADGRNSTEDANSFSFTKCDVVPFEVVTSNHHFNYNPVLRVTPLGKACSTLAVVGTKLGISRVTVSYVLEDGRRLSDNVVIATHLPLKTLHPESGETVLAVGTSRMIAFIGGPQPWLDARSKHTKFMSMTEGSESELNVTEILGVEDERKNIYVYEVVCLTLGEFEVMLHMTNTLNVERSRPAHSQVNVKVHCAKPRYSSLRVNQEPFDADRCPLKASPEKAVVHHYNDIEISVIVKDAKGRTFDNVSSLHFEWKVSNMSLARTVKEGGVFLKEEYDGGILIPGTSYQVLVPLRQAGVVEVSSLVVGYNKSRLLEMELRAESPPFGIPDAEGHLHTPEIKGTIQILLVDDIAVIPSQITIFNHPENKVKLQVSHGSGFFDITVNTPEVGSLQYTEGSTIIEVIPENDGLLKLAVVDLCLKSKAAFVDIMVLGLGAIDVNVLDKVERGSSVRAIVGIFDTIGNALPIPGMSLLTIVAVPGAAIISVERDLQCNECALHEMLFLVSGVELGDTTLAFTSRRGRHEVRSRPVSIQVFPPLKLFPRKLTLLVMSTFQVTNRGGPQPECDVEYSVQKREVISITASGIIKGHAFGSTTITGRAVGFNKITGQKIVYSEDSMNVRVTSLKGIQIYTPLRRIKVGCTVPVYAVGLPDLSPLVLGTVNSPVLYHWGVQPKDVAVLENVFESLNVKLRDEDKIYLHLRMLKVGRVTLYLNATVPSVIAHGMQISAEPNVHFRDSVDLQVFGDLQLLLPTSVAEGKPYQLLMAPHTEVQLKTNRDEVATMSYSVQQQSSYVQGTSTALENATRSAPFHVVSVDKTGLVKADGWSGHSFLMLTALEEFNIKQSISIAAVVEQVTYTMVNVRAKFIMYSEKEVITALPKGVMLDVYMTYHDNVGNVFTSTRSDIKVRGNRFDISDTQRGNDNATLAVHLRQPGKTILKLWDANLHASAIEYLPLRVTESIFPAQGHVTVGDLICFTTPMVRPDGRSGVWNTSNDNILSIDPFAGIARAKQTGSVVVHYTLDDDDADSAVELEVLPVDYIKFLPSLNIRPLSNSRPEVGYTIPLVLASRRDVNKVNNVVARSDTITSTIKSKMFPYMCELQFDSPVRNFDVIDIFAIHQSFDSEAGMYQCSIIPSGLSTYNVSVMNTNFSLYVIRDNVRSPPLHIPFVPAFFLHTAALHLSDLQIVDIVTVSGRQDVVYQIQVVPENDLLLSVDPAEYETENRVSFRVYLKPYYWELGELSTRLSIFVVSELSYQNVEVPVRVRLSGSHFGGPSCVVPRFVTWMDFLYYSRNIIGYIVAVVVIVIATLCVYSNVYPLRSVASLHVSGQSNFADTSQAHMTQSFFQQRGTPDTNATVATPLHRSRRFL